VSPACARIAAIIFAVAFVVRLGAAVFVPQEANDSARYVTLAHNLRAHGTYSAYPDVSKPTMDDAPLYPLVLVLSMAVFGAGGLALRLPGIVFGAAAAPVAFFLASRLSKNDRTAAIAGIAVALLPSLVAASTLVLTEGLYAFALALAALLYLRAWRMGDAGAAPAGGPRQLVLTAGAAGAVLALAALVRPVAAGFFVVGGAGLLIRSGAIGRRWAAGALLAGAYAACFWLVLSPWVVRNYAVTGGFVPLTSRGPGQLWLGSYEPSGGRYTDESYAAYQARCRELSADELKAEALQRIAAHPFRWAGWGVMKVGNVWLGRPGGERLLKGKRLLAAVAWLPDLAAVALAALAIILLVRGRMPPGAGALLLYLATETAAYFALLGLARFRIPLMPLVIVLAALAAENLRRREAATASETPAGDDVAKRPDAPSEGLSPGAGTQA